MNLEDRLDHQPEAWRPEKAGDKVVGRVAELDLLDSKFGGAYPLVVIETSDGRELAVHAFHTVLKSELARKRPVVGEQIGIAYLGKNQKGGYEGYRVIIERDDQPTSIDWAGVAAEAQSDFDQADEVPPVSDADAPPAESVF